MTTHAPTKVLPSAQYLRECFTYDRNNGELRWRHRARKHFATSNAASTWNTRSAGMIAGRIDTLGYSIVRIGRPYRAHRLIWKLVTGNEPPETVDHRDGNKNNNAWSNLRAATIAEQKWNSRFKKNNVSGHRGVYRSYEKWQAQIGINGKTYCLGTFKTIKEASSVYEAAARKLHGAFYRQVSNEL